MAPGHEALVADRSDNSRMRVRRIPLTVFKDLVPYWANEIFITEAGYMEDEEFDHRQIERLRVKLVQLWSRFLVFTRQE